MSAFSKITRRNILQLGLGAAAGAVSGSLFAQSNTAQTLSATPAQTEGPFYPIHDQDDKDMDLTQIEGRSARAQGDVIYVTGQVLDENHNPIPEALVDVWQANTHGRYAHEDDPNPAPLDKNFQGWGQIRTDKQGHYGFKTIVPGAYPVNEEWWRPPHIHFKLSKRGYHELTTQMYFPGHELNDKDGILLDTPENDREKLIMEYKESKADDESGSKRGVFNIILRQVRKG
jgi:protocatechuate 3,4-dioxygenase beta subunit